MRHNYYTKSGGLGLTAVRPLIRGGVLGNTAPSGPSSSPTTTLYWKLYSVLSFVGSATGAYHGYKRNRSVGWAVGWFFFGGIAPVLSIPISLAQGYGKPRVQSNRRRRRTSRRR
jgi:hypothetical protein